MTRYASLLAIVLLPLVVAGPGGRAAAAPETAPSADDPLKEKGLSKHGNLYVAEADNEVVGAMKELRALRKKVEDDNKARVGYEQKIKMAKNAIGNWDLERRKYNEQYVTLQDVTQKNQLVAKINALTSRIDEATQFKNDNEAKLRGLGEETRTKYVNQVVDLAAKIDKAQKDYEELAGDADVKAALDTAKPKGRLGPSAEFTAAANQLKKWRADINSEIIPVVMENHVPNVEVTLNGKVTRTMVLDSGAGIVAIPADLAGALELVPGPNDPTIRLTLADGKVVEARQMMLKSVRVGTFTVEDVECAVLPASLIAAQPLLGGSFLRNFIYRVDADAGQLHLAQVGGGNAKKTPGGVAEKPDKR